VNFCNNATLSLTAKFKMTIPILLFFSSCS